MCDLIYDDNSYVGTICTDFIDIQSKCQGLDQDLLRDPRSNLNMLIEICDFIFNGNSNFCYICHHITNNCSQYVHNLTLRIGPGQT